MREGGRQGGIDDNSLETISSSLQVYQNVLFLQALHLLTTSVPAVSLSPSHRHLSDDTWPVQPHSQDPSESSGVVRLPRKVNKYKR